MNVFTTGHRNQPWVWQVTGLRFVLGVLLAGSLQTVRNINRSGYGGRVGQPIAAPAVRPEKAREQEREIESLRKRNTDLENALGNGNNQLKTLNDELQKVKILAGLTEVHGPGVVVILQDSKGRSTMRSALEVSTGLIHDEDLQRVINELGQSGAEVIAVNNQRIINRTALRCVGPTILVNNVPLVPPYSIHAIGDPATLYGGLNLPSGVLEPIRRFDPEMVKIEKKKDVLIPAYTGSTEVKIARPTVSSRGSGPAEASR